MDSMTNLLSIFADHLSMKSNQIAVQRVNAELPVIARARESRLLNSSRALGPRRLKTFY